MRQRLAKLVLRLPFLGRLYLKSLLRTLEKTPRGKLPPELRQLQAVLSQVPPAQRLELLENAVKGRLPQPETFSREMRRAAQRQQRRRR